MIVDEIMKYFALQHNLIYILLERKKWFKNIYSYEKIHTIQLHKKISYLAHNAEAKIE